MSARAFPSVAAWLGKPEAAHHSSPVLGYWAEGHVPRDAFLRGFREYVPYRPEPGPEAVEHTRLRWRWGHIGERRYLRWQEESEEGRPVTLVRTEWRDVIGAWPGDETDEQVEMALEELS